MKKLYAVLAALALFLIPVGADATCTQAIATQAKGNWMAGAIRSTDTFKIAAYTSSATWDATTATYSATNEIAASGNYPAGGFTLATPTFGTSTTVYWMTFADEVNSNITFASQSNCVLIYDSTSHAADCSASGVPYPCCTGASAGCAGDMVLGVFTHTSVQPAAGELTYDFPAAAAGTAIFQISLLTDPPSWNDQSVLVAENGLDKIQAFDRLRRRSDALGGLIARAGATAGLTGVAVDATMQ
jgi:hypothetical protein